MSWESFKVENTITVTEFYTLYNQHYNGDYNFLGEMHDFWECLYVVEGSVCVSADERIHNLSTGDIIFHKPMELHKFYVTDKNGADLLVFSFNMVGTLCEIMQNRVAHLDHYQHSIIERVLECVQQNLLGIAEQDTNKFLNLFSKIKDDQPSIKEFALLIEQLILSLSQSDNNLKSPKTAESLLFKKAVSFMRDELKSSLTVSELAFHLNISTSGLKRLFSKYAGMSVHKYFLSLKMKSATALLQSGMTVSEVADELGFSSQGYFSAVYKRETGKNPSQI